MLGVVTCIRPAEQLLIASEASTPTTRQLPHTCLSSNLPISLVCLRFILIPAYMPSVFLPRLTEDRAPKCRSVTSKEGRAWRYISHNYHKLSGSSRNLALLRRLTSCDQGLWPPRWWSDRRQDVSTVGTPHCFHEVPNKLLIRRSLSA